MKISIITVSYNAENTIEDTIRSVISQTVFNNIEYILIDGNSTDGTMDIVNKYRQYFSIILSESDNGIYDAMNKGIKLTTGEVVGILNADDLYVSMNIVESVMDMFLASKGLDILYGDLFYVKKEDTNRIKRKWVSGEYNELFFEKGNVPAHPTLFLRKTVYEKAGLFDTSYKLAADYEFMLRIFKKFTFLAFYYKEFMIKMRLGGATNKNIKNIFNGNIEIAKAWKQNKLRMPIMLFPMRILKKLSQLRYD